jgi:hypothetical protein
MQLFDRINFQFVWNQLYLVSIHPVTVSTNTISANICSFEGGRPSYLRKSTIIYDVGFEVVRRPAVNSTELRYYYDEQQGRCLSFLFRGDFGNYNNFLSASDCELFCANRK